MQTVSQFVKCMYVKVDASGKRGPLECMCSNQETSVFYSFNRSKTVFACAGAGADQALTL